MSSNRDLRIDSLRGFAICVMAVAHLDFPVLRWTRDLPGHTGAPEFFVFVSGIVAGMVYGRMARHASLRQLRNRALGRARLIYLTYLGLVLYIMAYTFSARAFGSDFVPAVGELFVQDPWRALLMAASFLYMPGYANILPMYAVFAALMPLALPGLLRGHTRLVLSASVALWIASHWGIHGALIGSLVEFAGAPVTTTFDLFAWQMLFVFGLWIGVRDAKGDPIRLSESSALTGALVALLLCSFAIRHEIFFDESVREAARSVTRRSNLYPLRLANFAALAFVVARLGAARPDWLVWRWLAFLGQHSLQVFTFSVAANYVAQSVHPTSVGGQLVSAALLLASLSIPAWVHVRYREARAGNGVTGVSVGAGRASR